MNLLLEINIYIALFYLIYKAILSNKINPRVKRLTLVSIPLLGLVVFYLKNALSTAPIQLSTPSYILEGFTIGKETINNIETNYFTLNNMYTVGVIIFSAILIYKFIKLIIIYSKVDKTKYKNLILSSSQNKPNFSFLNWIHLNDDLDENQKSIIQEHEEIHIKQKHSFDILYLEVLKVILWFNPFIYLIKKDLELTHEEEVDAIMHNSYGDEYIQLILGSVFKTDSAHFDLSNQFLNPKFNLKTRIKMMKTKRKNQIAWLIALPLVGSVLAFTGLKETKSYSINEKPIIEASISDTTKAEYKGGVEALYSFLGENIKYPESAKDENIEGTVYVQFTISDNGSITHSEAKNNPKHPVDERLEKEALRVINSMPEWNPATANGIAFKSTMQLPIAFKLPKKEEK